MPKRLPVSKLKFKYSYQHPGVPVTKYFSPSGEEYWLWEAAPYGWSYVHFGESTCMIGFFSKQEAQAHILAVHQRGQAMNQARRLKFKPSAK